MNEDFYITLIYKKLTDSISTEEGIQLDNWLQASEENRLTAQSVTLVWNQSETLGTSPKVDLDTAFDALDSRIKKEEEGREDTGFRVKMNERRFSLKWFHLAASIALVFAVGLALSKYIGDNSKGVEFAEIRSGKTVETIVLSDGSRIKLNKDSYLKYPTTFSGKERQVVLEGEAFFEVSHNPENPFVVKIGESEVKVLGTSFNIWAFPNEEENRVQVVTGRVQYESMATQAKLVLTPGDQAIFNKKNQELRKIDNVSPNELFWHTQNLSFIQTPVPEVIEILEKNYDVKMDVENAALLDCTFNSTFKNPDLETIIETMSGVLSVEFVKKDNQHYRLKGGECER